ncbi:biogenesis of lysosome-related organelles complex 1 subunit 1-like [Xenopus laevis]|uniref:Biogenesis of lysosome-related organelles complex 1 subunit 1 n=1 Tax=Xenopus laevis TaxID=8355 RepID=A0A8J0UFG1_XENLA|nr:biogenesis of lysosome-related organelles complex 1 subunit 1-like [Xenopus laevis]
MPPLRNKNESFHKILVNHLFKEHQAKWKELQEKRRKEEIVAATTLTEALVDHLNVGVAQAYVKQRKLDHEVKTLQRLAAQFGNQTTQWIGFVENFIQALKVYIPVLALISVFSL